MKMFLGAAIGNCVHVGGVVNFLRLAEDEDNKTEFLGAAVSINRLIDAVLKIKPDVVSVGFRLTPESVIPLLNELQDEINANNLGNITWLFGGTKPVADMARRYSFFSKIFDGTEDIDDTIQYLKGNNLREVKASYPQNLIDRINSKYPYPVLRHHFGLPSLDATFDGIKKIAESKVLDIISVGPDQNAQENFFTPEKMNHDLDGAGGVPLRSIRRF